MVILPDKLIGRIVLVGSGLPAIGDGSNVAVGIVSISKAIVAYDLAGSFCGRRVVEPGIFRQHGGITVFGDLLAGSAKGIVGIIDGRSDRCSVSYRYRCYPVVVIVGVGIDRGDTVNDFRQSLQIVAGQGDNRIVPLSLENRLLVLPADLVGLFSCRTFSAKL